MSRPDYLEASKAPLSACKSDLRLVALPHLRSSLDAYLTSATALEGSWTMSKHFYVCTRVDNASYASFSRYTTRTSLVAAISASFATRSCRLILVTKIVEMRAVPLPSSATLHSTKTAEESKELPRLDRTTSDVPPSFSLDSNLMNAANQLRIR